MILFHSNLSLLLSVLRFPFRCNLRFWIVIIICAYFTASPGKHLVFAQSGASLYPSYDRSTQQTLVDLERLVSLGQKQEVNELINRVINGVGYIQPLAKIFYKMAQTETEIELLVQYYTIILKHYSKSAWAQQAVIDFVPVMLMSGEQFGQEALNPIWSNLSDLLSPATDAKDIPENADVLRAQVFLRLMQLSHHRREAERIVELKQHPAAVTVQDKQDVMELASIFAQIRLQHSAAAETSIKQWLQSFPQSSLRPFALKTLFEVTQDSVLKDQIVKQLFNEFSQSLEAEMLKNMLSAKTN